MSRSSRPERTQPLRRATKLKGIQALLEYFLWSEALWAQAEKAFAEGRTEGTGDLPVAVMLEEGRHWPGGLVVHWLASLLVVVEGWERLGLTDPAVDRLVSLPHASTLRNFRNVIYHFSINHMRDARAQALDKDTREWAGHLTDALQAFFRRMAEPGALEPWLGSK